jgi:heavy metal translocating P-type ATPase
MLIKKWLTNEPKPTLVCVIASGVALALSLVNHFHPIFSVFDPAWIAAVLCGIPIIVGAAVALVTEFDITADLLVTLALLASLFTKEWFAAGEVAFIMQIGSLLEDFTSDRARQGISALINLTPKTARVVKDDAEKIVPVEAIAVGDTLSILAGETIPVDGVLIAGQTSVNQAAMTGESVPVEKKAGDDLLSGTINQAHPIQMRVNKVSGDSTLQRMINLAKEADANKAPIVSLADKWATWMVLVALGCAVAVGLLTGMFSRAVTVLVVFCPCAFVLATPTAVAAAIGNLTHYGILVKSGDALERLSGVDTIAFDKTGTLTKGTPAVTDTVVLDPSYTPDRLLQIAASVEHYSEHPFGKAIVTAFRQNSKADFLNCQNVEVRQGEGIQAEIDGQTVLVGKASLFDSDQIQAESKRIVDSGSTPIAAAVSGKPIGLIALADPIREEAKTVVTALKNLGIHPVMLTGDRQTIAEKIAGAVGIDDVHSELMPEDKMAFLKEMSEKGHHVAMTGDGINDALALSSAYAGIAMGGIGSDIAVESASAVLVSDDLKGLLGLFDMSHQCMRKIKQNIVVAMILNFTAIVLSGFGLLVPITGALWHNCGSVFVVINAALLLRKKHQYD